MTDQELLLAIRSIVREEAGDIVQRELTPIRADLTEVKDSMKEVRDSTNYISEWVERLEQSFKVHEIKTAQ